MNDIIDFLTSKEIIVVYIVVAVACLLCFVIYLIDKNYAKRKRRQNTKKLNKLVEDVNIKLEEENKDKVVTKTKVEASSEPVMIAPSVDVVSNKSKVSQVKEAPKKQSFNSSEKNVSNTAFDKMEKEIHKVNEKIEELVYTDIEPDREQATRELMQLTLELEKAELEKKSTINIEEYESAQEENAIISLEELTKKSSEMYLQNEVTQYADEGNEPISLEDLELRKKQAMNTEIVEDKKEEVKRDSEYYSQMISPVFNYNNKNDIENTADYDKFDEELQKTQEFLISLKDLQSKLNS